MFLLLFCFVFREVYQVLSNITALPASGTSESEFLFALLISTQVFINTAMVMIMMIRKHQQRDNQQWTLKPTQKKKKILLVVFILVVWIRLNNGMIPIPISLQTKWVSLNYPMDLNGDASKPFKT